MKAGKKVEEIFPLFLINNGKRNIEGLIFRRKTMFEKVTTLIVSFVLFDVTLYLALESMLKHEPWAIQFVSGLFVPISAVGFAVCFWISVKEMADVIHRKLFSPKTV